MENFCIVRENDQVVAIQIFNENSLIFSNFDCFVAFSEFLNFKLSTRGIGDKNLVIEDSLPLVISKSWYVSIQIEYFYTTIV